MAWTDLVHKFLGHGKYNATLPSLTDGSNGEVQLDSRGRLVVSVGSQASVATESSSSSSWTHMHTHDDTKLITASAAKSLAFFYVQSSYASSGYIQFHNQASVGAVTAGAEPHIASIAIPANGLVSFEFPRAKLFSTGIVMVFSSTANIYTAVAAATVGGSFEYV